MERALAIFEAAYGSDRPEVAQALDNLGVVLRELGELPQARAHHKRALAIFEATYGPDHPDIATTLDNLGAVLRALGEPSKAQTYQQRAQTIKQKFGRS
jgi:tetratricopeptide (TPR) repeat protein